MAVALRSRLRLSSITSRNGSQKLVDRARFGSFGLESLNPTPNPVVTSFSLAGFVASDPVVTWVSLAGFAGGQRAPIRGGRAPRPGALRGGPAAPPLPP